MSSHFLLPALLACIIHKSFGFVNNHPQQLGHLCCGFRQVALHPLKANPERRPERPQSNPEGRIRHEAHIVTRIIRASLFSVGEQSYHMNGK